MTPHYADQSVTLWHGDCLDVLRQIPDASVDSIVTDPPYGLGFMGKDWDDLPPGVEWATECLRVLKPGGHLLAFGGSRTWHRLAAAVEDAGFEIRDSIAWLYGSGFPKSLDVSKAIDKQRTEDREPVRAICAFLRSTHYANPRPRREIDEHFGTKNIGGHWFTPDSPLAQCPTWEQWLWLRRWLGFGDEMDAEVWRINGRKGRPGDNFEAREVLSERTTTFLARGKADGVKLVGDMLMAGERGVATIRETAPATPAAEQWQGWGTALKPAHEPVVCGVKPYSDKDILAKIGSQLDALEDTCRRSVSGAARSSAPTPAGSPEAKTDSAPASAATQPEGAAAPLTPTGAAAGSSEVTDMSASEWTVETFSSTVTSWKACWVELWEAMSTSTTSTATSRTTDLQTLSSCLSQIMQRVTARSTLEPASWSSIVTAADNLFAAGVLSSRSTLALSAIGSATSATRQDSPAVVGSSGTAFEPVVVGRKPLIGTVAANVLTHGTGALNIDGCRIGTTDVLVAGGSLRTNSGDTRQGASLGMFRSGTPNTYESNPGGRWPANVVLDESQAGLFDESRFMYVAKAPKSERPRTDDGTAHPTVKPLALMRWLVRLVTPPGGTVLEPFAGSGTTVEACLLEGFNVVAIEREADYLPLIEARLARVAARPVEDMGLLAFLDGETA